MLNEKKEKNLYRIIINSPKDWLAIFFVMPHNRKTTLQTL